MKKLITALLLFSLVVGMSACASGKGDAPAAEAKPAPITFEETVVIDSGTCTIKITDIKPKDTFGYSLSVYLENKTEVTQTFAVTAASTNGVDNDPYFAADVDAGKASNQTITFSDTELEKILGTFTDICLTFRVYDSDDWFAEPVAETTVHVYPYGEEKATAFAREAKVSDQVIIDNEKVTAIVTGFEKDDLLGYVANLYLVNKTDTTVMFTVYDVSVNEFMIDPYYADQVAPGCTAFSKISWPESSLNENGITKVESIQLTMRAYNYEDWLTDDFAKETVTLNP